MKPNIFSRVYENLDQEIKNACLKYERVQSKKGLKVTKISLIFTPDKEPYFEIDIDEEEKLKKLRAFNEPPVIVAPTPMRLPCDHEQSICNGLGRDECVLCEKDMGVCGVDKCPRCADDADAPPTMRSSRFPVVPEVDEDEEEEEEALL